jgi:anti-anti-sigma factor
MTQPEDLLSIDTSDAGLVVAGEIDAHTAPTLAAAIEAAGPTVRVDLSAVAFVDSSGLRVLIDAHQHLSEAGGALTIASPSDPVVRLFEISGVQDYLLIEPA